MKKRDDCIFCKIVAGEIPCSKVYEDDKVLAFLDIHPINPGHTLVIPKDHYEFIGEVPSELCGPLYDTARKITIAQRKCGFQCDAVNIHLADGAIAGQEIPHTHIHIIPRFKGDGAGYRIPPGRKDPEGAELNEIAGAIKSCL
jgi:histidine triad (HIT) family protein